MTITEAEKLTKRVELLEKSLDTWKNHYSSMTEKLTAIQYQAKAYQYRAVKERKAAFAGAKQAVRKLNNLIEAAKGLRSVAISTRKVRDGETRFVRLTRAEHNRLVYLLEKWSKNGSLKSEAQ